MIKTLITFFIILIVCAIEFSAITMYEGISKVCEDIKATFLNKRIITIYADDGSVYYCSGIYCISPDFAFTVGFDYYDNFRYNRCIENIYTSVDLAIGRK